jgi:uncharacterized protein (DUF2141 family)
MKFTFFILIIGLFSNFLILEKPISTGMMGSLTYRFTNLPSTKGVVRIVLYDQPDQFLSQYGWCRADSAYIRADGSAEITIENLTYGKYAAAIYHDENQNGMIDRNLVGMPTEAYGFSNNIRAKWSIPGYDKVQFPFENNAETIYGKVQYWSKQ